MHLRLRRVLLLLLLVLVRLLRLRGMRRRVDNEMLLMLHRGMVSRICILSVAATVALVLRIVAARGGRWVLWLVGVLRR